MKTEDKKPEVKPEAAKVNTPPTPPAKKEDAPPPAPSKKPLGNKSTYATLWQEACGKKVDPNEKDSKGSPVLEKYYRHWLNAD